jgi:tRNA(fMet)-specific endonuclease VapC
VPYLFDTSALSIAMSRQRIERHPQYAAWLRELPRHEQFTCATVVGELRFGARHAPERMKILMSRIDEVLGRLTVVPYDLRAAERYAEVRMELNARGIAIGEADMQIAACALINHCSLVTANTKHFSHVPNLPIQSVT